MPDEATYLRTLAVRAVRARGVPHRLGDRRALAASPAAPSGSVRTSTRWSRAGELDRHEVEDGGAPLYVVPEAEPGPRPTAAVLLSPFDNLIWDRAFTERLFGFRHMIEVYKPAHQRRTATTCCRSCAATGSSAAPT